MKLTLQTLLNNRYKVTSYLSQGGFGYTYLAMDNLFNEKVCVKELYISGRSTRGPKQEVISENNKEFSFEYFADRFWDEARQLASFNHSNIVKVKDFFKVNGTIYMVMEFVEGETLQARKIKGGLEDEKSLHHVMSQLLDAVEEVHRHGILHRDIKPENILITKEDKVVLIDFGSARDFEDGKTVAHTTLLTPGYAPIEQYSNRAKRGTYTDIYALGATMYFLLTGEKPLAATDRHLESLIPPHIINSSVSSQLSSAVMMAMEMKPEDRFQDVGELRDVLNLLHDNKNLSGTGQKIKPKLRTRRLSKDKSLKIKKRFLAVFIASVAVCLTFILLSNYAGEADVSKDEEEKVEEIPFDGMTEKEYREKYPNLWREKYGPGTDYYSEQRTPEAHAKRRQTAIQKAKIEREYRIIKAKLEREAALRRRGY
jgi:serine/threonine protein kinase